MRLPPPLLTRFTCSSKGAVAIEFAFLMPVLIILLMLGVQVVAYVNCVRKVELLATSISEMISQAAPQPGASTAYVNAQDLHFAYDAGLVVFPYLMSDARRQGVAWWQDIYIDFASVQFTSINGKSCPANGDQSSCYNANVVWTSSGTTGTNYRACGTSAGQAPYQQPMNDTSSPSKLSLPRSIFGAGSVVVIDVVFTFHPVFAGNLLPTLTIARSVYVRPRYATLIDFDTTNNDGIATLCNGYS